MKQIVLSSVIIAILLLTVIITPGCTSEPAVTTTVPPGDNLLAGGENEFQNDNLHAATRLFTFAQANYTAAGDTEAALKARDRVTTSRMLTLEFPYNRSTVEEEVAKAFPDASPEEIARWLDANMTATINSDGEILYFSDTVSNIRYHNLVLMQKKTAAGNHTPLYDEITPLTLDPQKTGSDPYGEPVSWKGVGEFSLSRDVLPDNGTLKLWISLPIETGSQTNVTIDSVEPAKYVKSSTGTTADLGLVYLEIPLEEVNDPSVNVTARFRFLQHEQRFEIDPAKVEPYNTSDPMYLKYTTSSKNIVITPEMKKKAQEIIGNETNPYLQAKKIFWYIVDTLPYSKAPHTWLDASNTPESVYVLETGIGDCGSQSMYFAALCRSIGIPARATGGYQMIMGNAGTHFWAEYYLEGYGWIPVDVTAAEGADWSYNATPEERHRYKEYFFGSLDPYRYIIQKDMDIPFVPETNDTTSSEIFLQEPKGVCDTCTVSPNLFLPESSSWSVTMTKE
ncbi:MAG: transglutaminase-like domain-containing protein [Methanospirillum sp.]|nr:transglutaminase-like domain-containing protein [Methanospirillum sp.]